MEITCGGSNIPENIHKCSYNNCSKILKTFLFLFSNKILVYRDRTHKILVRTENREDPDQTASGEVYRDRTHKILVRTANREDP